VSAPESPDVSAVELLPTVPDYGSLLASRESVATAVVAWAKRRIMNKSISDNELEALLLAARAAGDAEGYARAKFEMALERARAAVEILPANESQILTVEPQSGAEKLEVLKEQAKKAEGEEVYKTRTTVSMTKTIALDYLKNAAPRIVGPSEIKKNSEKALKVFISFGTLSRAMAALVESGHVEQIEASRWKYKGSAEAIPLKSVR
jgi:hypothetical protein